VNEIDRQERRHRKDPIRPVVCLITGDRDFSGTVEKLKAEGFDDFVLIHRDDARPVLLSNAPYAVKWSAVRALNEMPISEQLSVLSVPAHFRVAAERALATRPSFPITVFDTMSFDRLLSPERYQYHTIFSVLCRLRSIGWVVCAETYDIVTGEGLTFCRITAESVELKRQSHARYAERHILPELREKYSAERAEGVVRYHHVEIKHVSGHNVHRLMVRSVDPSRAHSVAYEVKNRLIQLTRCTETQPLEGWTCHHADAFISSKVLCKASTIYTHLVSFALCRI
jgi:hypothetical protein